LCTDAITKACAEAGELARAVHVERPDDRDLLAEPPRPGQPQVFRARLRDRVRVRLPLVPGADLHHGQAQRGRDVVHVDRAEDVDLRGPVLRAEQLRGAQHAGQVDDGLSLVHAAGGLEHAAVAYVAARLVVRDDLMTPVGQLRAQALPDEPGRPGDQDFHASPR
jgi:hypothetical protein